MKTKTVSQLDPSGYFMQTVEADESPLEPGVWLIPGGAVDMPAPQLADGQRARHDSGAWVIEDIPVIPPEEPPQPTPEEIKALAISDIERRRDAALRAGVVIEGVRYHTDDTALTELLGMIMGYQAGVYAPTELQDIRSMDNAVVQLNAQQITALASAVGAHRKAVYAASWAEKDAL